MPQACHLYVVQMDVPEQLVEQFEKIYGEHVGYMKEVPGVISCSRYQLESSKQAGEPRYTTIYEIVSPEVTSSQAWQEAAQMGDWYGTLRQHTSNKRNFILRKT